MICFTFGVVGYSLFNMDSQNKLDIVTLIFGFILGVFFTYFLRLLFYLFHS